MGFVQELRNLIRAANAAGRGRLDSTDWEDKDEEQFLHGLDEILEHYGLLEDH